MKGVAVLWSALLVGCASHLAMPGGLTAAAARGLECGPDEIKIDEPTFQQQRLLQLAGAPTQAYAHGCGKRLVYAHMCRGDGSQCGWYSVKQLRIEPLLERAAFDMHCTKAQLTTQQLAPSTVGVRGCERQGTYVWSCPHNQDFISPACNWVLNNGMVAAPATAAP